MPPEGRDAASLWDMIEAARSLIDFVSGISLDPYKGDRMRQRAVEREVEIIGAAARKLTEAFRSAYPDIPWRAIIAQRNILAHEYGDVDSERLWRQAVQEIPKLPTDLEAILVSGTPDRAP